MIRVTHKTLDKISSGVVDISFPKATAYTALRIVWC